MRYGLTSELAPLLCLVSFILACTFPGYASIIFCIVCLLTIALYVVDFLYNKA